MSDEPKNAFPPRHDDDLIPRFDDDSIPNGEDTSSLEGDRPAGSRRSPNIVPRFDDESISDLDITETPGPDAPVVSSEADYVSSIRESLVLEETEKARPKGSSGLLRLITGSLKRVTSPLRKLPTKELGSEPLASANIPEAELEDDFLSGRLGGVALDDPLLNQDADTTGYVIPGYVTDDEFFASTETPVEEFGLPDDSPITLLDSGAIAALGKAEEEYRAEDGEQQWMEGLRGQNADQSPSGESPTEPVLDKPADERPRSTGVTGQLRSFITGVLRPKKHTTPLILPDEMLAGRINRSLMTGSLHMPETVEPAAEAEPVLSPTEDLEAADTLLTEGLQNTATDEQSGELTDELSTQWADIADEPDVELTNLRMELDESPAAAPEVAETEKSPWDRWSDLDETQTEDPLTNRFFVEDVAAEADLPTETQAPVEPAFSGFQMVDEADSSEDLPDDRFAQFDREQPATDQSVQTAQLNDYPFNIDDQETLWGQAQPSANTASEPADELRPEDIWGTAGDPTVSEQEGWNAPTLNQAGQTLNADGEYGELFSPMADEDYAAAYLGGLAALTYNSKESSQSQSDRLLRHALERAGTPEIVPVSDSQDMREIALEDYEGEGLPDEETRRLLAAEAEEAAAEEEADRESHTFKAWLAKRTMMEKILLAEAVVVVLALVVALPIFLVIILRGSGGQGAQTAGITWPMPRPLPANVPYPTALTLPGGWNFPLGKSTFFEGQWKPAAAEWLEGTEVRRVVALPWNRQTQAVMQTFQVGDVVELSLTNNDLVKYKVDSIERMPSSDSTIFTGRKPSLVIILYQEDADERWVAVCSPSR